MVVFVAAAVFLFIGEEDLGCEGMGVDEEEGFLTASALLVRAALPNE